MPNHLYFIDYRNNPALRDAAKAILESKNFAHQYSILDFESFICVNSDSRTFHTSDISLGWLKRNGYKEISLVDLPAFDFKAHELLFEDGTKAVSNEAGGLTFTAKDETTLSLNAAEVKEIFQGFRVETYGNEHLNQAVRKILHGKGYHLDGGFTPTARFLYIDPCNNRSFREIERPQGKLLSYAALIGPVWLAGYAAFREDSIELSDSIKMTYPELEALQSFWIEATK